LNDTKPEVSVVPEGAMMDTFQIEKLNARAPTEIGITKPSADKFDDHKQEQLRRQFIKESPFFAKKHVNV